MRVMALGVRVGITRPGCVLALVLASLAPRAVLQSSCLQQPKLDQKFFLSATPPNLLFQPFFFFLPSSLLFFPPLHSHPHIPTFLTLACCTRLAHLSHIYPAHQRQHRLLTASQLHRDPLAYLTGGCAFVSKPPNNPTRPDRGL